MANKIIKLQDRDGNILLPDTFTTSFIEPGTNLNTFMHPGIYRLLGTYTNSPFSGSFGAYMMVIVSQQTGSSAGAVQRLFTAYHHYFRVYSNGAWSTWRHDESAVYYPGDTVSGIYVVAGHVTASGANLYFNVPLSRPILASTLNVTSLVFAGLRTAKFEYLKDGNVTYDSNQRSFPLDHVLTKQINPSGVRLTLTASTRWNNQDGTMYNNAPVIGFLNYTFSFS